MSKHPIKDLLDVMDELTAEPAPTGAKALPPSSGNTATLTLKLALSKVVDLLEYMTESDWTKADVTARLKSIKGLLE